MSQACTHPQTDAGILVWVCEPNPVACEPWHCVINQCLSVNNSTGHNKDVVDLSACSSKPGLLVSLSKDGNARVWDVTQELCISSYNTDASCLVRRSLHPFLIASQHPCVCFSAAVLGKCTALWVSSRGGLILLGNLFSSFFMSY